jgi:hypothetical protein
MLIGSAKGTGRVEATRYRTRISYSSLTCCAGEAASLPMSTSSATGSGVSNEPKSAATWNGRTVSHPIFLSTKKIRFSDGAGTKKRHYNVGRNADVGRSAVDHEFQSDLIVDPHRDNKSSTVGDHWNNSRPSS